MTDLVWTLPAQPNQTARWEEPSGGGGGSSAVLMASKAITSAQLLDLQNTPVEILPAPGGRFYYVIHNTVLHYRFVTTPYNEGGSNIGNSLIFQYGNSILASSFDPPSYMRPIAFGGSPLNTTNLFKQTEDSYVYALPEVANVTVYEWVATTIENQPLCIAFSSAVAASLTGGDSTLTVRLFYSLIDGA